MEKSATEENKICKIAEGNSTSYKVSDRLKWV
jgi:hypothetical protein